MTHHPFAFEDLDGKPDPDRWGPLYPKTASSAVEKWRKLSDQHELTHDEKRAYGAAVHAWINTLNQPKKTPGALPTRSSCASGQPFEFNAAKHRATLKREFAAAVERDRARRSDAEIVAAYEAAMVLKRSRPKPRYTLRNGQIVLMRAA